VLREEDPYRPYLPSSPYVNGANLIQGQSSMPEAHLWGSRHDPRADYFKQANCHFISEFGFLGCPSVASIRKFIPEEHLWPYRDNPYWTLHATSPIPGVDLFDYRVDLLAQQVATFFDHVPENIDDYAFASQVCQAEGLKLIIERFRSQMWRRTGVLWWNIMDGWPQFSDAVVDYYFEKKLAYEFIRRAQEALCLVIRGEENGTLVLVAINDTREDRCLDYCVQDVQSERVVAHGEARAKGDAAVVIATVPDPGDQPGMYRLRWTAGGEVGTNHFLYGKTPYDLTVYRELLAQTYRFL
jgi:beta-mannosidase